MQVTEMMIIKEKNNPMVMTMMAMKWHSRTTVGCL